MGQPANTLKITGAKVFRSDALLLTSPLYGAGMVLDSLQELWNSKMLQKESHVIFVGSMGSLSTTISLGQVVLPNPCLCAYYGYEGIELHQDQTLFRALIDTLEAESHTPIVYRHGSSFAVFDPHTDHSSYTSRLCQKDVIGVDCGEVFLGMEFCRSQGIASAAVLYCSDTPNCHIVDVGEHEFAARARQSDILLNTAAARTLNADDHLS